MIPALLILLAAAATPPARLKQAPNEIEHARSGPANLTVPTSEDDVAVSAAEDRKRDEMIAELNVIIPKIGETDRKADLYFQLAELWWEKARYTSILEMKAQDDAYAAWAVKREGPEPKADTARSEQYRKEALKNYETVLRDYPDYARNDEVLFVVGYNLYESGRRQEAAKAYTRLIHDFRDSRFVPDAYVQLGEYHFQNNELEPARAAFEKAASFRLPKLYAFALYKLAWCDYNKGDYAAAIDKLKEVVRYSDAQAKANASQARDRIQLKNEALKDLVLAFSMIDAIEPAAEYYHAQADGGDAIDYINKLAAQYFDSGKFEQSIRVYRMLQAEAPMHVRAPAWQQKIVLAFDKLNQRDQVAVEMKRLVSDYGPRSGWAKINAAQKGAVDEAGELAETALRDLVQDYHHEALKTKSVATYRLARDIYRQYLEQFPNSEAAYDMRFYYAEILYALEEWDAAAEQYGKVVDANPKGNYATKAAYDGILALEKSVAISKGRLQPHELADATKIDDRRAKGQVDQKRHIQLQALTKDTQEEPVPENEARLIEACDRYAAVAEGSKDEIVIRYKAAFIFYEHRHFVDAAKRFGDIILKWPTDSWSQKAADLSLDILNTKEEWVALGDLAHKFLQNRKLAPAGSELARRVAKVEEGARFKAAMAVYDKGDDFPRAAKEFNAFVASYPKSEHAPKALYNALVIADRADQLDVELQAGTKLVKHYPDADPQIVRLTVPALASAAERSARFDEAIRWYEDAANRWPDDAKAADWLYNASVLREDAGDLAGAVAGFRRYVKQYGSRPDAARIAFKVGLLLEREKDRRAADYWRDFQREHAATAMPAQLLLARYKEAIAVRDRALLSDVAQRFDKLPGDQKAGAAADAAAHARFLLVEPQFDEFTRLAFGSTRQRELVRTLKQKNARMQKLLEAYGEVIQLGSAAWTEAAFTRIGQAYRNFNQGLLSAPVPHGLDAEQQELYRSTLESQALPLEDKAVEAFRRAVEASQKSAVYTEWTLRAEDELRELQPDSFGEVHKPALVGVEPFQPVAEVVR